MIDVLIQRSASLGLKSITISGHADSAPHGQDLVCAAVSAIGIGTLNALEKTNNLSFVNQEGFIEMKVQSKLLEKESIVLETMLIQLKTVAHSYPKFIKIIQRKVT
jgi:uncharacterized protein